MALQTSGAISLNQIHIEAGGTSGTTVSFNDSDIRGLTPASGKTISTVSGSAIDFADFYGASDVLNLFNSFTYAAERANQTGSSLTQVSSAYSSYFASIIGTLGFRLRLDSNVLHFEVKRIAGGNGVRYDGYGSGVQDGTTTSIGTSYVSLGTVSVPSPVDVKVNWAYFISGTGGTGSINGNTAGTGATYSLSDNTFQTLTNGQSAGFMTTASNSRSYSGSQSRYLTVTQMKLSLQKTGYTTAEVADFDAFITAIAQVAGGGGGGGGGGGFEP
jgi:hypothetical protein